ncbi:MAG: hypothetical protein ACLFPE_08425 [Bacteroidales bacterium]
MKQRDEQYKPGGFSTGLWAGRILLVIMALFAILHVLVLTGMFPSDMVWGGLAEGSPNQLMLLETIALFFTLVFLLIVGIRTGFFLRRYRHTALVRIGIWIVFAYFILNAIGNFLGETDIEKYVFGPLTILMAVLSLLVALRK